jgi:hypothetical protein
VGDDAPILLTTPVLRPEADIATASASGIPAAIALAALTEPTGPALAGLEMDRPRRHSTSPVVVETLDSVLRDLSAATSHVATLFAALAESEDRDELVVSVMEYLAKGYRHGAFLAIRGRELAVFQMTPTSPSSQSLAGLPLDQPSVLQQCMEQRIRYLGPASDDLTRTLLASLFGIVPGEFLVVPVIVRERGVGLLYVDTPIVHWFDDHLGAVARGVGIALERIVKSRRAPSISRW